MESQKSEKKHIGVITPKIFRRDVRIAKRRGSGIKYTNFRKPKGTSSFNIIGIKTWNPQAIYIPKRKKLKGWQKNLKRA